MILSVLDSFAIMAYLEKEAGYEIVQEEFKKASEGKVKLLMTTVNWGEIYYILRRECGESKAEEISSLMQSFPIEIVSVDLSLAKLAAKIKSMHKLSYADCFAAALAGQHRARLLTGDPEFKEIEKEIKIIWIK